MTNDREKDTLVDRILRKIITFVVVMAVMIPLITPDIFAASTVSISGGDNVKGGDKFTVAVTFDGGNIGRVDAHMTYDTNKLTYLSGGTSSGNTGYIQLKTAGTSGNIIFNLEFQAVSEGTAALEVITDEMYNFDEVAMDRPTASKTITISGDADAGALITEAPDPEEPVEATELIGVDEIAEEESGTNLNVIFIAAAAILVILIVIVSIVLAKKKKKSDAPIGGDGELYEDQHYDGGISNDVAYRGDQYGAHYSDLEEELMRDDMDAFLDREIPTQPGMAPEQYDERNGYAEKPRIGRSGKVLDAHPADDNSWLDDLMTGSSNGNGPRSRDRDQNVRKRANEETELWREWDLNTREDSDDIEKW